MLLNDLLLLIFVNTINFDRSTEPSNYQFSLSNKPKIRPIPCSDLLERFSAATQIEMTSVSNFGYQRLRNEGLFDDDGYDDLREKVIGRQRSFTRFRKVHIRRRLKIRIPSLGRLFRRKASLAKIAWTRVIKRLKDSQSHFGDLFAGNYLFMQVTPTLLKGNNVHKSLKGYPIGDLSSRYSVSMVA